MKLFELNSRIKRNILLTCGYGRTYGFRYTGDEVHDYRPNVLSLGRYMSPRNNQLMAGVNLNYLSTQQTSRLQQNLSTILKDKNLRRRARKLRTLMPDVFNTAYRTYKRSEINNIDPGTLKYLADRPEPDRPEPDRPEPDKLEPDKLEPDKLKPDRPEPDRLEPDKLEPDKLEPDKLEPDKLEPDRLEPDRLEDPEEDPEEDDQEDIEKKPIKPAQTIKPLETKTLDDIDDVDIEDEENI